MCGTLDAMEDTDAVTTQDSRVEDWTGLMLAVAASLASMVAGHTEPDERERAELHLVRMQAQALRKDALRLADQDPVASRAFGAAFGLEPRADRDDAISLASVAATKASAELGMRAIEAIDGLAWLAVHGNVALIADVVVAFGALRATVAGARTNASFDLALFTSHGNTLDPIREEHPELWAKVSDVNATLERIDSLREGIDHRAAPTDAVQ